MLILVAASLSVSVPNPFVSNQNTYFIFSIAKLDSRLNGDWRSEVLDTNQFFSAFAYLLLKNLGISSVSYMTYVLYFLGIIAIYLFAHYIYKSKLSALISTLLVAVLQSNLIFLLPGFKALSGLLVPFEGLAGQYLFLRWAFLQPSTMGIFVLLGMILIFINHSYLGFALIVLGCMFHPSLLVPTLLLLTSYLLAKWWDSRRVFRGELCRYLFFVCILILAVLAANPNILYTRALSVEERLALHRLSFERIPHHTLMTEWPPQNLLLIFLWAVSIFLCYFYMNQKLLSYFLSITLLISILTPVAVLFSKNPSLALLFPWRLSVVVAPLIYSIICLGIISFMPKIGLRFLVLLLTFVIFFASARFHVQTSVSPLSDEFSRNKHTINNVGFIPLQLQDFRLRYRLPVFVDWKSHPYSARDLVEWWRRVDFARKVNEDPSLLCKHHNGISFEWVVLVKDQPVPDCFRHYSDFEIDYKVLIRKRP